MTLKIQPKIFDIIDKDLQTINSKFDNKLQPFIVQIKQDSDNEIKTYYMKKDSILYRYDKTGDNFLYSGKEIVVSENQYYQDIKRIDTQDNIVHTYRYHKFKKYIVRDDNVETFMYPENNIPDELLSSIQIDYSHIFGFSWKEGAYTIYLNLSKSGSF